MEQDLGSDFILLLEFSCAMGTQKLCLPLSPTKPFSVQSLLSAVGLDKLEKSPREIFHPEIPKDLLVLEEQEGSVNFNFGVPYAKDGQLTDDEMFSNGKDSRVLVVRLSAAQEDTETKKIISSKYDCRENKRERTKEVDVILLRRF